MTKHGKPHEMTPEERLADLIEAVRLVKSSGPKDELITALRDAPDQVLAIEHDSGELLVTVPRGTVTLRSDFVELYGRLAQRCPAARLDHSERELFDTLQTGAGTRNFNRMLLGALSVAIAILAVEVGLDKLFDVNSAELHAGVFVGLFTAAVVFYVRGPQRRARAYVDEVMSALRHHPELIRRIELGAQVREGYYLDVLVWNAPEHLYHKASFIIPRPYPVIGALARRCLSAQLV